MKELYSIMDEFLAVETEIAALKTVTSAIAANYYEQEGQRALKAVLCVYKKYIQCLETEIHSSITKLDEFLAVGKQKQ